MSMNFTPKKPLFENTEGTLVADFMRGATNDLPQTVLAKINPGPYAWRVDEQIQQTGVEGSDFVTRSYPDKKELHRRPQA